MGRQHKDLGSSVCLGMTCSGCPEFFSQGHCQGGQDFARPFQEVTTSNFVPCAGGLDPLGSRMLAMGVFG